MDFTAKFLKAVFSSFKENAFSIFAIWDRILSIMICILISFGFVWYCLRYTIPEEMALRHKVVSTAETYLGRNEADHSHQQIIDRYNAHLPRARGYEVTYSDSWCAVFGSAVAMELGLTEIIPAECSCEQQISLFSASGSWMEQDGYLPKAGDYIFYDWNYATTKDSKGWSDHVGIVVRTIGPVIQVIEGNKEDDVSYRYIFMNDPTIRGFGLPDYGRFCFFSP